ncbi:hypothetical protein SERLA73DRAFT_190954 [Serpula lacrymans var. lacrymans S7.3]|uniref:Glucose-methanol-choline oxidoreductase N-terminal domain-containing protein n=1 Tax=Serpula lacrymans var. lacrymans (strain S7.3) TaxID=936435 RepID=F8QGP2_SERL3|nr:hypothetical protein SERLA73DRAFT_190954 [Serpula lacrymans var. lacrymans S7.3]
MSTTIQDVADQSFDFVVIGGGAAGLCLASRLAEESTFSVLVLEAGQANLDDPAILLPAQYGTHFGQSAYDWQHETVGQEFSNGRTYSWNRGKGLGGSSGVNFLCWMKPPKEEIDDWERLGNPGWNWERYQQKLRGLENFHEKSTAGRDLNFSDETIGVGGPIHLHYPNTITRPETLGFQTWLNLGVPRAPAPVNGNPKGALITPKTIDPATYTRSYATTAFYLPNAHRANFHVMIGAHVNRILTRSGDAGGDVVATSVEFSHNGSVYTVNIGKEVILSAGALKSPQILELSGIGRKDVLGALGIPVKVELPGVGENVQEHLYSGITYELADDADDLTLDILRDPVGRAKHLELLAKGEGAFTAGICEFAFMTLQSISDRAEEIKKSAREKLAKNWSTYSAGLRDQYEIQLERLENAAGCEVILVPGFFTIPNPPVPGKKYFTILFALNHNFSRGTIHATSADPNVDSEFNPHNFEEDVDLQTFIELLKYARKMSQTAPLKEVLAKEINPGPEVKTDSDMGDYLKQYCATTFHTIASLSMMPLEKGGVVDSSLKVYGTSNIRVADLSIVPLHVATHTLTTAYSIGAQAADIIKEEYNKA